MYMEVELFPLMVLSSVNNFFGLLHCINVMIGVAAAQSSSHLSVFIPEFGFFVKIHLLVCPCLDLYD